MNTAKNTEQAVGSRFIEALTTINSLEMMRQLDSGIKDIVATVMDTGEKGKLTLSLEVIKSKKERQLIIKPSVKVQTPSYIINSCVAYADTEAMLHQDDPNQMHLDLEDAPTRVILVPQGTDYRKSNSPGATTEDGSTAPAKVAVCK